jgi:hypothetical protein
LSATPASSYPVQVAASTVYPITVGPGGYITISWTTQ